MKQYFVVTDAHLQAKNNAEKEIHALVLNLGGTLIYGEESLNNFIDNFKSDILAINERNKRCRDIEVKFYEKRYDGDCGTLYASGVCGMNFKEVKHEFPAPGRDPIFDLMGNMKADAE